MAHFKPAEPSHADIAIIGCGPVGAMLANLLGMQGISTVVLERAAEVYSLPRACHFDDEVMRVFQTVGLADEMVPLVHVSPGMRFVDDSGTLLLDWTRPAEVGPQGWNASYRFHQPELERVLRDGLARFANVTVQLQTEVFALEQGPDAVSVRYEDLTTGTLQCCRVRYVVGCDGARSLVRRMIGAPMEDLGFHERWLVVDAILKRPRPDLGDYSLQFCSANRPATYVRGTGDRRRWEITVLPGEDGVSVTNPGRVFELLAPWVSPDDVDLERAALYTFHSALAHRWRNGRLLIAGDSAHLTPPFLGQGMCAGMRDVANLAWKLARILAGQSGDDLLDTYQAERSPHVREYIELAVRLGGLINTKAMDKALAGSAASGEPVRMSSIKPRLGAGLAPGWNGPAGSIAPQPRLGDGTRLDDHVGYRFTAVMRPDVAATLPDATRSRLADRDIVVVADDAPEHLSWLDEHDAVAVVVRPDRYVLGAASSVQQLDALAACI